MLSAPPRPQQAGFEAPVLPFIDGAIDLADDVFTDRRPGFLLAGLAWLRCRRSRVGLVRRLFLAWLD